MPATGSRSMLSVIVATFLMAVEGFGQSFIGLSTTWDGSTLYFSTALRQAGTGQPFWGKLFVADKQGIRLFLDRETVVYTPNPNGTSTSNPFGLGFPQVSDDGTKVAFVSSSDCTGGGSGCIGHNPRYSEIISGGQTAVLGLGQPSLSHNVRFLTRGVSPNSFEMVGSFLHDLESGASQ